MPVRGKPDPPRIGPSSRLVSHSSWPMGCGSRGSSLGALTLTIMIIVVMWAPAANIYIMLTVCTPGTIPNAMYTADRYSQNLPSLFGKHHYLPISQMEPHGTERLGGLLRHTDSRCWSWDVNLGA